MARRNIEGFEEVDKVFRRLPRESLERITNALNKGADEIVRDAKIAVPRSEDDEHVADTIGRTSIRAAGKSAEVFIFAGVEGAGTEQAAFRSEFGRKPGSGHPGHRAQPFMFPALAKNRKRVLGRIRREINRAARFVSGLRPKA
jgi:hypothetical protein